MELIRDHIHPAEKGLPRVAVSAERSTLAKRRWRANAADGLDFGFDLEYPLADGDYIFESPSAVYFIEQRPEPVLEIALGPTAGEGARLGWLFGNLHFPIQITQECVRVMDDPAVRQVCERERLPVHAAERVFKPLSGSASHGHHHHEH